MGRSPIAALRRIVNSEAPVERCDFCNAALPAEHPHVLAPTNRQISCACGPCAVLFSGEPGAKYRRVPRRVLRLADFRLTDAQWESLGVPIELAFFFRSADSGRIVALYPSPAGATECSLELESWNEIALENPILNRLDPDVEALLVNRVREAREYYLAPIDECYKLVGLIRTRWRGLSGGAEVWKEIAGFFAALKERAGVPRETTRA